MKWDIAYKYLKRIYQVKVQKSYLRNTVLELKVVQKLGVI